MRLSLPIYLLLVVASVIISGCFGGRNQAKTPEQVAVSFARYMHDKEFSMARELVTRPSRSVIAVFDEQQANTSMWEPYTLSNPETANCVDLPDGSKSCEVCCGSNLVLKLVDKNGKWLVDVAPDRAQLQEAIDEIQNTPDSIFDDLYNGLDTIENNIEE